MSQLVSQSKDLFFLFQATRWFQELHRLQTELFSCLTLEEGPTQEHHLSHSMKTQEHENLPVPYPWTVSMIGPNSAVKDVELLNPWNAISAVAAHRHYIARVQGQPLNTGLFIDETYDIGRIEDVHFNPWYSTSHPFIEYQLVHGRAFVLGRSDWEYVLNTFAFGYSVGYHFITTPTGNMNGNFLGIGADLSINASVLIEGSQAPGVLITNGEFTAFRNSDWLPGSKQESTQVVVTSSNTGPVKFIGSSFWGPSSQIALINGTGSVSFTSCQFVEWDEQAEDGRAAVKVLGGSVVLMGNEFAQSKTQLEAVVGVKKVVLVGNLFTGKRNIVGQGNVAVWEEAANAWD
eukprot:c10061_g1_i3.p1 GENE.c10061_g1_i3~~c10061_g1_i3.p1  ORF type:complete len:347 (+),score=74.32 c10061_g1_i3:436-1476(+)